MPIRTMTQGPRGGSRRTPTSRNAILRAGIRAAAAVALASILLAVSLPGPGRPAHAQSTAQRTQFHSELIRMLVQPGRLTVNALYRFVAPEEAREFPLRLFFPYPQDSLLGDAEMAMLEVALPGEAWRDIGFTDAPDGRGARWRIPLIGDTTLVRAVYHQELLGPYARYVVTTTNIWNRPLEHARFEVFLPESARAPEFSFPFAPPEEPGAPYIYEAEDFLPDRDITVRWSW
jgi:hypothetical protein